LDAKTGLHGFRALAERCRNDGERALFESYLLQPFVGDVCFTKGIKHNQAILLIAFYSVSSGGVMAAMDARMCLEESRMLAERCRNDGERVLFESYLLQPFVGDICFAKGIKHNQAKPF
jgi:hypothetical protein